MFQHKIEKNIEKLQQNKKTNEIFLERKRCWISVYLVLHLELCLDVFQKCIWFEKTSNGFLDVFQLMLF